MIDLSDDEDFSKSQLDAPAERIPPAAAKHACDLLVNFGYCPGHPTRAADCLRNAGIKCDERILEVAAQLYDMSLRNRECTAHTMTVDVRHM